MTDTFDKKRFKMWYNELKEVCGECYECFVDDVKEKEWLEYYEDGYSPAAAAAEEFYFE